MTKYDQETKIESQSFEAMRRDANAVLQRLLKNMVEKNTNEGTLTIKIDVMFLPQYIPIPPEQRKEGDGETRKALKPQFKHKIASTMQVKGEASGRMDNESMELVWDGEQQAYILTPVDGDRQMSVFDYMKAKESKEAKEESQEDGDDSQKQINGRSFLSLPEPTGTDEDAPDKAGDSSGEVIDGEFREVDPDDDSKAQDTPDDDDYEYQEPEEDE